MLAQHILSVELCGAKTKGRRFRAARNDSIFFDGPLHQAADCLDNMSGADAGGVDQFVRRAGAWH
jgi:hypothetical protein